MAKTTIELDSAGIREILNSSEVAAAIHGYADQIADSVRAVRPGVDVVVDDYQTDRAASSVTIRDVRGQTWQANDGILTKAATAAGLEVNRIITYTTRSGKTRRATEAQVANWTRGRRR